MTLVVHKNARCLSYLDTDSIVEIARFNQIFYYYISYISPKYDEAGYPNEYLTIMGRDAARILYERIIERPDGKDFHSVTDRVDNCMKDFVRKQLVTGEVADGNRDWPNFSCEADDSEHADTETFQATYKDNLGALLESIGSAYSIDFWVENVGPITYIFRTQYPRRGEDNSSKVVFSTARHNILTFEHWEDAGEEKTLVYVAGAGELQSQIIEKYPAAEPTGADRKEAYVAATYIEAAAQLEVYGDAFLDTFGQAVTGVSFKFHETESCKWGIDFDIGDLVTVWDPEFDKTEQIKVEEITVRVDAQGQEILEIRVGKARPSAWDMLLAQRRLVPQDRLAPEHDHGGGPDGPPVDTDYFFPPLYFWSTIDCPAGTDPVPDIFGDTLALTAGANISIAGDEAADSVTIAVTGVTLNAFKTISCPAGTNPVADAIDDTLTLVAGANISITGDQAADSVTFAVTGVSLFAFKTIDCPAGTDPVADSADDTLQLLTGTNMTITGNTGADSVTIGLTTDRLNSVDGVSNPGGNVDFIAGTGIAITPNDGANTVTFAVTGVALFAFKTIDCPAGTDPVADATDDTLQLLAGTNIAITGNAGADSVTIGLTTDRLNSVDGVSNAGGDIDLIAGAGISITPNDGANTITIAATGVSLFAFKTITVPDGGGPIVADAADDTLVFSSGPGFSITGVAGTDTITFAIDSSGYAFGYVVTQTGTISADQVKDTFSILGGDELTTWANVGDDAIVIDFDYTVDVAASNNTVVRRSAGGSIWAQYYYLGATKIIDAGRNVVNMVSCNLVAHGGYGLPWVRVPTSHGVRRLTAIESPVFLFQDVADEIDPLFQEISEGEIWVAPLFRAVDGETPEWQKLSQREPDKWLILTQRPGYAGIRFQEAPPVSEEKKPETPYWAVEDIEKDRKNCNGCKTIRQ